MQSVIPGYLLGLIEKATLGDWFQIVLAATAIGSAILAIKGWRDKIAPFIRIQFTDLGSSPYPHEVIRRIAKEFDSYTSQEQEAFRARYPEYLINEDKRRTLAREYNKKTDIELVNDGKGPAYNLEIFVSYLDGKNRGKAEELSINAVTAIKGNGGQTRIAYDEWLPNNRHQILNDRNLWGKHPVLVTIYYQDILHRYWRIRFVSAPEKFNDCFYVLDKGVKRVRLYTIKKLLFIEGDPKVYKATDAELYNQDRLKEVDRFQEIVETEGHQLMQELLDDDWFHELRAGGSRVWSGDKERYECRFFPFRWLWEEGDWSLVNSGIAKVLQAKYSPKKLKRKLDQLVKITENDSEHDWMQAMSQALEINIFCRFAQDNFLMDYDVKTNKETDQNVDALIRVENREIAVEATACVVSLASPRSRGGALSVNKMIQQIERKISEKAEGQLKDLGMPTVLIISLPPGIGADQHTARSAVIDGLAKYPQLSAILIADSYLFRWGKYYLNDTASFPLTEVEKQYISELLKNQD